MIFGWFREIITTFQIDSVQIDELQEIYLTESKDLDVVCENAHQWCLRAKVSNSARYLILESIHLWRGCWTEVHSLSVVAVLENDIFSMWRSIQFWMAHLRISATPYARTEQKWLEISKKLGRMHNCTSSALVVQIEQCGRLMGRGLYRLVVENLSNLPVAISTDDANSLKEIIGTYYSFRYYTLKGTCFQALGRFPESWDAICSQDKILENCSSNFLTNSVIRRKISYYIEHEEYQEAKKLLSKNLIDFANSGQTIQYVLFLQEQLRIRLVEGNLNSIQETFEEIEKIVKKNQLSPFFLSMVEERCEVYLRESNPELALEKMEDVLAASISRGDFAGQCVGYYYVAKARLLQGNLGFATEYVNKSISIAREYGYGKILVRLLFCASSIKYVLDEKSSARVLLEEAGKEANRMKLQVQVACYKLVLGYMQKKALQWMPLIQLQVATTSVRESLYYLSQYSFENRLFARLTKLDDTESQQGRWSLEAAVSAVVSLPGIHWFPGENFAWVNSPRQRIHLWDLQDDSLISQAIKLFISCAHEGFTLADLHSLQWPNVRFQTEKHRARCQTLLARMRKFVLNSEIMICYDTQKMCYLPTQKVVIYQWSDFFTATENLSGSKKTTSSEQRLIDLMLRLRKATTSKLCSELSVTRQTLHPILKKLVLDGKLTRGGRGPASFYLWKDN